MSIAIRRLFSRIGVAVLVALVTFFVGTATVQAEVNDPGVKMTHGGVHGRLVGMKLDKEFKSSAVPVGGNSSATPTVPARISIYNTTGTWNGSARTWMRKPNSPVVTSSYDVTVDEGDPLHFSFTEWGARYRFTLYGEGGRKVRTHRIWTSRGWARRHAWTTRQRDVVVTGTGGGGGNNNPPPTGYPKGAVVSVNGRQGSALTRIDYTAAGGTLSFAYPNVTTGNWGYEAFPAWYTNPATQVSEKVTWSDAVTETKTVSAPMSATADATVTTFTGP